MSIQVNDEFVPETDEFAIENVDARPEGQALDNVVQQGWAVAAESVKPKEFAKDFKISETPQLVKFIGSENGPIKYKQHWLEQKSEGQRSYTCLESVCPLCLRLKDVPEKKFLFSVAVLTKEEIVLTKLIASPKFFQALLSAEHNPTSGPLLKNYWALSRFGKMQQTTYTVTPVKGRDLMEDWGIDEATAEAAIAEMKAYDSSSVRRSSVEELNEIVDALI